RPGATPAAESPRSATGTTHRTPTVAAHPTALRPTGAGRRPAGSGSTPRTDQSDPAPTYAAPPAHESRSDMPGSSYGHARGAGRSPRSTNPAGATRALPLLPRSEERRVGKELTSQSD